jgi:putative NADPH-quinone reductase
MIEEQKSMKVSIILCHQHAGSFNHAIAETAKRVLEENGHSVRFHDLYLEKFDPILPHEEIDAASSLDPAVEAHCREIAEAEGIIIVHPNWWSQMPAVLKGWLDRVFRAGVAYKYGESGPVGLLTAKTALVFNTANTPHDVDVAWFGDPLEHFWKTCVFNYCGVKNVERKCYCPVIVSTPEERQKWLQDVASRVGKAFPA